MKTRILWALPVLLLALPVAASDWLIHCRSGNTTSDGDGGPGMKAGDRACVSPSSNSDDTQIIAVGGCENIDAGQVEDQDGDGTGGSALTATLQWCPVGQGDSTVNTDALRDVACVDYSGGTLTGDGAIQGAGVPSGYVRFNLGGTFAGDPQLWIKCNGPSR